MKVVAEDYLRLYQSMDEIVPGKAVETTMEHIANTLFCTPRNAKYILNKLIEQNWIAFFSGSGRGHKSTITFFVKPEDVIMQESERLIQVGEIATILSLVSVYKGDVNIKELITDWLNSYFGYQHGSDDTLRFPIFRPINTLDPINVFYDFDAHMIEQIYNTLLTVNSETGKLEPQLAHYWEANADYTSWRFYIRKGILFHHGRELEAKDVVYTLNRFKHSRDPYAQRWMMEKVAEVIVLDRYTVEVHLSAPNAMFAQFLSFTPAAIVPYDVNENSNIGTGPFKVSKKTEFICILEVFLHYFQGRAHLDKLEVITLPIDLQGDVTCDLEQIFVSTGESTIPENPPDWDQVEYFYSGSSLFSVNLAKTGRPQTDPLFRKALSMLINRQKLIDDLGEFRLYPSDGFQYQHEPTKKYNDTLEEAKMLLEQSSYNGELLSMYVYARHSPDAYWLKKELAIFGIRLHVQIVSWQEMLFETIRSKADFVLFEATWSQNELSHLELLKYPSSFIRSHLRDDVRSFVDRKVDELLTLPSEHERAAVFKEIELTLKADHALIFLVHKSISSSFHSTVKGVRFNTRSGIIFKDIWFQANSLLEQQ